MSVNFRNECKLLSERLDVLNRLLGELKQQIILQDLSAELNMQVKVGRHLVTGFNWLEEIDVEGESFNFINKSEERYSSYVVYTKKEYHTVGLGFIYKNNLISPHVDFCVDKIISKYSDSELAEIMEQIRETVKHINNEIDFLKSNTDINIHEHYYGEYNKGFESHFRFETISEVIIDYKKRF